MTCEYLRDSSKKLKRPKGYFQGLGRMIHENNLTQKILSCDTVPKNDIVLAQTDPDFQEVLFELVPGFPVVPAQMSLETTTKASHDP